MNLTQINETNLKSVFIHYVMNSVIAMAAVSFNVFTDTFFIANGIGSFALAPLNIALPIFYIINGIALMVGMGCATKFTLMRASQHQYEADEVFTVGVVCILIQSIVFMIIGFFFVDKLAILLGANEGTIHDVVSYLKPLTILGFLFQFNQLFTCMIRNDHAPSLAMFALVIGNCVNILLDYVFIYIFNWGLFGASLASCCSPLTSLLILSLHRVRNQHHFHFVKIKFNLKHIGRIYHIGFPYFITELSSAIVMFVYNYMLLMVGGNVAVSAYGIISNLSLIIIAIFSGVGQGIQPIVSHLMGNNKSQLAWVVARYGILLVIVLGFFFTIGGMVFPDQLIAIFNSDGNKLLQEMAREGILLYFPAFIFSGFNILSTAFFASIQASNESATISMGRGIVFILFFLLTLPFIFGEKGVWISMPLAEICAFALTICFYRRLSYDHA